MTRERFVKDRSVLCEEFGPHLPLFADEFLTATGWTPCVASPELIGNG